MLLTASDLWNFFKYIIVAIVQGVAEILPISSSGHITLFETILDIEPSLTFSVLLHAGSLIAVIIYFRKELWKLIRGFFLYIFKKNREDDIKESFRLVIMLIIATIPAGLIGVFLGDFIDNFFRDLTYISINFLITGIILLIISRFKFERKKESMTYVDALVVGSFQAIGVLPGISRSGITITGLKARKFSDEDSANFAFLMFIPITAGSFFYEVIKLIKDPDTINNSLILPYIVGVIVASVVTYLALHFLLKIIRKGKLQYFSIYLFILGITVLVLSLCNVFPI